MVLIRKLRNGGLSITRHLMATRQNNLRFAFPYTTSVLPHLSSYHGKTFCFEREKYLAGWISGSIFFANPPVRLMATCLKGLYFASKTHYLAPPPPRLRNSLFSPSTPKPKNTLFSPPIPNQTTHI